MKVLIADDHDLVRDTIAAFLRNEGIDEVLTAASLGEAIEIVEQSGPCDLILLDYNMPGMVGLEGLARMKSANGDKPVAILSGTANAATAEEAIRGGAAGFVPKTLSANSIVSAVRFMAAGETFVPFNFLTESRAGHDHGLTDREMDVLRGLCEGKSNKEIARDLDLQEVTIKLHVKTLCRKLGARNRTHAAMIATSENLV